MSRAQPRATRSKPVIDRITLVVLLIFLIIAAITAVLAYQWARTFFASWAGKEIQGATINGSTSPNSPPTPPINALPGDISAPPGSLDSQLAPTPVPWDGSSRVTILLMGLDYRDWSDGMDIPRTDSMILLSVDPLTKTAGILSIPRDLWVPIPGMENNKINTAYRWGELYKQPDGPTLAMKTVEGVIGVPIQYYALIDFESFVKFIDSMGGLDMKIRESITIDPIGPGNTVTLEPGTQTLTGAEALAYARERYQGDGDFSRSQRQQEVIMAIRKQILTLNMLPMLVTKAPALYGELKAGIRTNLTLDQVIRLAWLGSQLKDTDIKKGVFDPHKDVEMTSLMTPDGVQDVLIPIPDQIRLLRDEIFATGGPAQPASVAEDPVQQMTTENAKVRVLNGTTTAGLAAKTSDLLKKQDINITAEDNAGQDYGQTTIIDYTGKPYTVNYLIKVMSLTQPVVINRFDPTSEVDIDVIVGEDWARQQP